MLSHHFVLNTVISFLVAMVGCNNNYEYHDAIMLVFRLSKAIAKIMKFYLMGGGAFLKALMEGVVSLYWAHIETKSLTLKMG